MKNTFKVLSYLVFMLWCIEATKVFTLLELSYVCQSVQSDLSEDEQAKDSEPDCTNQLKTLVFRPIVSVNSQRTYHITDLFLRLVWLEVNAPPPDLTA